MNLLTLLSIKMSVDVIGRNLKEREGIRGPPGVGYKITSDGQFDLENKRLCIVGAPNDLHDAVNVQSLQRIVEGEVEKVVNVIHALRNDFENLDGIVEAHRDELDTKIANLERKIDSIKVMVLQLSYNSNTVDTKESTSKHESSKESSSRRVAYTCSKKLSTP